MAPHEGDRIRRSQRRRRRGLSRAGGGESVRALPAAGMPLAQPTQRTQRARYRKKKGPWGTRTRPLPGGKFKQRRASLELLFVTGLHHALPAAISKQCNGQLPSRLLQHWR
jgi:hypothetical protein